MNRIVLLLLVVPLMLLADVARAAAARAQRVRLHTGDVLIAPVVEQSEQQIVLEHPVMGRVAIPMDQVQQVEDMGTPTEPPAPSPPVPAPEPAPEPATPSQSAQQPEAPKSWFQKFLDEWQIQISFGFSHRQHNHEYVDFNAGLAARHESPRDRWKIDGKFFYAMFNKVETREEVYLALQKDWLFQGSPWFLFGQGEYAHDEYKSWEHRGMLHGGLGYDLKGVLGVDAKLRAGFGMTREFGGTDPDKRAEGLGGGELNWKITDRHSISGTLQWYPSIEDPTDYRIRATGDYTFKLTPELSLRLSVWDEYDSTEPPGFEENDLRVYGSMVFDF